MTVAPSKQYRPVGHRPEHTCVGSAAVSPKLPAEQFVHTAALALLYLPGEQAVQVALVDPGGQKKPGTETWKRDGS